MTEGWASLPLLPLGCILQHLSPESALAALSTCRHWRQAMLLYEGKKERLTLNTKNIPKCMFLTRMYKKHVKKLYIYINCATDHQLRNFLAFVLPQFFETKKLREVAFIGPNYLHHDPNLPYATITRVITESLLYKHSPCLKKLVIIGCELNTGMDETERHAHKNVKHYSKLLSFPPVMSPADRVLSQSSVGMMMSSTLKHIVFEYELVSTEALETFSQLINLEMISLNVIFKREMALPVVDWRRVNESFTNGLNVAVNIVYMPYNKFKSVIEVVLAPEMPLTSLKVMFCKTLYIGLLSHVCYYYETSLQELVWVDSPFDGAERKRVVKPQPDEILDEAYNEVNPFTLLCWKCINLRRLVIHGYWVWQYDLIGFVRLRKAVKLEVSSLYTKYDRFRTRSTYAESTLRVMQYDSMLNVDTTFVKKVNEISDREWQPIPWSDLPSGLRSRSTPRQRVAYILGEVLKPLGVT